MNAQLKKHIVRRWRIIFTLQKRLSREQRKELETRLKFISEQIRIINAIEAHKTQTHAAISIEAM